MENRNNREAGRVLVEKCLIVEKEERKKERQGHTKSQWIEKEDKFSHLFLYQAPLALI